jgi:hypothetical protein
MDHLFQLPPDTRWGGPEEPMLEAYATLGYLAGVTERLRLGALVGCALFRPGVQHLIVNMPDAWDVRHLELIGREVIPIAA